MLHWWSFYLFIASVVCAPNFLPNFNNTRNSRVLQIRSVKGNYCQCACSVGKTARVIGGNVVQPHEFPWLAALLFSGEIRCGGSLITKRHVLTAAHCVHGYDITQIRVILGAHHIHEGGSVEKKVSGVKVHSNYEPRTYNNDIAVMEIEETELRPNIRVACLPSNANNDYSGQKAIIAGWGRTEERGELSQLPLKLQVPVWSRQDCIDKTGYQTNRITQNMLCAGFVEGGKDACQGDSGGPLHIINQAGNMEIIGLVSWGRGCARPKLPGLYTKVVNYLDWIANSLDEGCLCSDSKQ